MGHSTTTTYSDKTQPGAETETATAHRAELRALDEARLVELIRLRWNAPPRHIQPIPAGMGARRFYRIDLDGNDPAQLIGRCEASAEISAGSDARKPSESVVPDAPAWLSEPDLEPTRSFLEDAGIPVPKSYAHDSRMGIDLLEDLGDLTLGDAPETEQPQLYRRACALIPQLQSLDAEASQIPAFGRHFDRALLRTKVWKWLHWTIPLLLGRAATAEEIEAHEALFEKIGDVVEESPLFLSHRDYKAENLHWRPNSSDAPLVLIDVQGAFLAPPEYDLVCLLYDLQVELDENFVQELKTATLSALPKTPPMAKSLERFDLLAVARLAKDLSHVIHAGCIRGDRRRWHEIPRGLTLLARATDRIEGSFPEAKALSTVIHALTPTVGSADSGDRGELWRS